MISKWGLKKNGIGIADLELELELQALEWEL